MLLFFLIGLVIAAAVAAYATITHPAPTGAWASTRATALSWIVFHASGAATWTLSGHHLPATLVIATGLNYVTTKVIAARRRALAAA